MKIYLDDMRPCPEGWTLAKDYWEFLSIWKHHHAVVTHISFDHDLRHIPQGYGEPEMTGYDCVVQVERFQWKKMITKLPVMTCHSSNPAGVKRIQQVIDKMKERESNV